MTSLFLYNVIPMPIGIQSPLNGQGSSIFVRIATRMGYRPNPLGESFPRTPSFFKDILKTESPWLQGRPA